MSSHPGPDAGGSRGLQPESESSAHRNVNSSSPSLPEIPTAEDLSISLDSIIGPSDNSTSQSDPQAEKVQKRASNVMKLAQENEKLKEELKAMTARLEAAERKRKELAAQSSSEQSGANKS
ncbi:hypothetical protein CONPUDRAFT_141808 [Coniophora puteana RWD-64-598 SS2]|uniref:BZIP domain-containing protein n=1 Tax=Coniophora puteana (strain RWD-64-598) TaxID=741705 RepID=A0A5M3N2A8_CONPW|nr:uncharacterized protein CONPUDRAFT_141808 [Coniophora puteana RWD-64-598 SS2]EIW85065.1 hypothetical protein CONPUDRAFT_141808 [Coniophora puteana RWD-64-598 SS2]